MLVSDQILRPDPLKGRQVLGWGAVQGLQVQMEVLISTDILQIHDVLRVLSPTELPESHAGDTVRQSLDKQALCSVLTSPREE